MFPQSLIEQHEITNAFKPNVNAWYNASIEQMQNRSNIFTIWETKKVHRDRRILNDGEYLVCEYKGQFSRSCNDKIMEKIIEKSKKGFYFASQEKSHTCYEIMNMILVRQRTNNNPPVYRMFLKERQPTSVVKDQSPDYFHNIFRHPTTPVKLMSMAKFGFVPQTTNNLGVGQFEAYEIT